MSEPARIESDADVEAAREALALRLRSGDLAALGELFELAGATVRSIEWVEPPR